MLGMLGDKKKTVSVIMDTMKGEEKAPAAEKKQSGSKLGQALIDAVKSGNSERVQKAVESIFYKIQNSDMEVGEMEEEDGE